LATEVLGVVPPGYRAHSHRIFWRDSCCRRLAAPWSSQPGGRHSGIQAL